MKTIISLISFSVCLLFVCKKTIDCFVLILYLNALMKVFVSCGIFLVDSFEYFLYKIISSAIKNTLNCSFPICIT